MWKYVCLYHPGVRHLSPRSQDSTPDQTYGSAFLEGATRGTRLRSCKIGMTSRVPGLLYARTSSLRDRFAPPTLVHGRSVYVL